MDEKKAREILGDKIQDDDGLFHSGQYLAWSPEDKEIVLDDRFTTDELEAIVWWMKTKGKKS